jgi:septum formation inhibitor MinC
MTSAIALEEPDVRTDDPKPAAVLRGSARGLEIIAQGRATAEAIADALHARLDEAPGFFKGSDVRVRVEQGPLPAGALAKLDEIAGAFDLHIVEVSAYKAPAAAPLLLGPPPIVVELIAELPPLEAIPEPQLAAGSAPAAAADAPDAAADAAAAPAAPASAAPRIEALDTGSPTSASAGVEAGYGAKEIEPEAIEELQKTRIVVGPIRSGVILDHVGHVVVFGDVNPGAEVRAAGNIVVLGRLRGTAHAAIGRDSGFILSLRLEPQQLRIGRLVARASDDERDATEAEIAHVAGEGIVVERYQGRLPRNLVASI